MTFLRKKISIQTKKYVKYIKYKTRMYSKGETHHHHKLLCNLNSYGFSSRIFYPTSPLYYDEFPLDDYDSVVVHDDYEGEDGVVVVLRDYYYYYLY